ncbi:spore germination protein KA [Fontibacillus phaseoli]|uniref:Spore germination protein KA n=1 Tax=Fontibacillus phaseoli TaxID=1416533 RepID=A0A369BCE5_9BACL|nr:spore germination protein [Fontibacillus phaseoli]RCX19193.1 spore germination protein KA [Fontibacillus phaseoli]
MIRNRSRGGSGRQYNKDRQTGQAGTHSGTPALSGHLREMLEQIRKESGDSPDIVIREFKIGEPSFWQVDAAIVYLNGLSDEKTINNVVMRSLVEFKPDRKPDMNPERLMEMILKDALTSGDSSMESDWKDMLLGILSGDTVILLEGCDKALVISTPGGQWRAVSEPSSQLVVRGPKDSFVESIGTNISLIRRRIKNPDLWLETMKIGSVSHTHVGIMYLKSVADKDLVEEVKERLKSIQIDAVLESAYIEEFIQDETFTPFPTVYNTERPDVAAGNLLEGRIILLVDGTPFVLILPTVFAQFFQSPEDYAQRYDISIFMRLIRYISFIILLLGPSVYIALTTFHYEMIPSLLLINFVAQREGVPFPAFFEAMLMEVTFEILREAGVRMPRAIGQTVSIVGALILGQAVVEAGIITPVMVIVVALTGIASFALPAYNLAIAGRLIRFCFMVLGGMFGFYGITLGLIVLVAHMNSLRSFGVPYLAPLSPFALQSQKDTIIRLPFWTFKNRSQNNYNLKHAKKAEEIKPLGKSGKIGGHSGNKQ